MTDVIRAEQDKQARRILCVRVSAPGYNHIRDRAARAGVHMSAMTRRMLAYASATMPEDWVTPGETPRA